MFLKTSDKRDPRYNVVALLTIEEKKTCHLTGAVEIGSLLEKPARGMLYTTTDVCHMFYGHKLVPQGWNPTLKRIQCRAGLHNYGMHLCILQRTA